MYLFVHLIPISHPLCNQSLYRSKTDLREKESSLKDNMAEKKALRDGLKEERKEALARKDAIEKGWAAYSSYWDLNIHAASH